MLIDQMAEDAQHAIDEIRSLAKGIFPPLLQSEGLGAAVTAGAANAPVPIIVDASTLSRFAPEVEAATYFAVSEAITNAVKHSGAQRIEVRLGNGRGGLAFLVRDEGAGFDAGRFSDGSGLVGMRDRLEALGGSLSLTSSPGAAPRSKASFPADPMP